MNARSIVKLFTLILILLISSVIGYYILYLPFFEFGILYLGIFVGIIMFLISLSMMNKANKSSLFAYIFFTMCCIFLPFLGGIIAIVYISKK